MDYYESNSRAVTCLNTALKSLVTQKVPNRDNSSAAGTAILLKSFTTGMGQYHKLKYSQFWQKNIHHWNIIFTVLH